MNEEDILGYFHCILGVKIQSHVSSAMPGDPTNTPHASLFLRVGANVWLALLRAFNAALCHKRYSGSHRS